MCFAVVNIFAQSNGNNCTDSSKCTMMKMDHSGMNHQGMNQTMVSPDSTKNYQLTAKEADSKLTAWNAVCPVRGEEVDPDANKAEYNGKVYGFCYNGCDKKFIKDPEKYSKNLSEDGKTFVGTN